MIISESRDVCMPNGPKFVVELSEPEYERLWLLMQMPWVAADHEARRERIFAILGRERTAELRKAEAEGRFVHADLKWSLK